MTAFSRLTLLLALVFGGLRCTGGLAHAAAPAPNDETTAQLAAAPSAFSDDDLARRTDAYGRALVEMKLPPDKIRRLRELIAVSRVAIADVEGEVSRGAYRSRQEAIDVFTLAYAEAEAEITTLLTPLQYARFTTARDELPARSLVAMFDRTLTADAASHSVTVFTDEAFESMVSIVAAACRRHHVAPDNTLPPELADEPALARYLAAKTAANTEITRGAAAFLTSAQIGILAHYQASQLDALNALWHHPPARPWAARR